MPTSKAEATLGRTMAGGLTALQPTIEMRSSHAIHPVPTHNGRRIMQSSMLPEA
jgi:hypothetical protein